MQRNESRFKAGMAAKLAAMLSLAYAAIASAQTATLAPPEVVLNLSPDKSSLHWTVDSALHTVHGTFLLNSGTLHFNQETGAAGGEIIAIATSGESGNGARDRRMHKEILETAKYPEVVFHPARVDGKVSQAGPSDVKLFGTMSIHGANHEVTAVVHSQIDGDHWTGTCRFEVPYVSWGIKDPSNFLLKVQPVVNVELDMVGAVAPRQTP